VTVQIAHLYATAMLAIAFFQVALILGAPLGRYTQGGQHEGALPLSGRIIAAVSIPVVLFQGLAILSAAGFPGLEWPRWTGWVALAVTLVSTVLNWITPSKPERAVWGPVMLVLSAMALVVMTA
jgi:cytochrome bd-type quinol oxidase subunit 2